MIANSDCGLVIAGFKDCGLSIGAKSTLCKLNHQSTLVKSAINNRHSALPYSHSIVDGGLELMSYTTRLMPWTSLTIRDEMVASRSCGRRAQSAVMPSRLSTARMAMVDSYVRASPITPTLCTGSNTAKD